MKKKKLFTISESVAKQYITNYLARNDKRALYAFCNRLVSDGTDAGHVCQLVLSCKQLVACGNVK